jgi:hypothetical protein
MTEYLLKLKKSLEGKLQNIKKLFANLRIFIAHPRKTLEACPQPDYFCQEDGADNEAPPRKPLSKERRFIFGAVFLLTLFGILMVYESSSMYAYKITSDSQYFLIRQVVYFAVSLVLFLLALLVDLDFLRRHNKLFLVLTLVLLALVPVIGRTAGGATRWFKLPGFNLHRRVFQEKRGFAQKFLRRASPLRVGDGGYLRPAPFAAGLRNSGILDCLDDAFSGFISRQGKAYRAARCFGANRVIFSD